jgi:hypothetical protein
LNIILHQKPKSKKYNNDSFWYAILHKFQTIGNLVYIENHPSYSPDLIPTYFYFNGDFKEKNRVFLTSGFISIVIKNQEMLSKLPKTIIKNAYKKWCEKLNWVIKDEKKHFMND